MAFIPDCVGRRHVDVCFAAGALLARMLGQRCGIHSTLSGDIGTLLKLRGERTPKERPEGSPKSPEKSPKSPRSVPRVCEGFPKGPRMVPKIPRNFGNLCGDAFSGTLREPFANPSKGDASLFFAHNFP